MRTIHEGLLDHFLLTFMYQDEPVQNGVKVTSFEIPSVFRLRFDMCDLQLPFILSAKAALSSRHGRSSHPLSL